MQKMVKGKRQRTIHMKKLLIIPLLTLFACSIAIAQRQYRTYKDGDHISRPALSPFVGTWVGTSGNTTLTIVLVKATVNNKKRILNSPYYSEKYKKNRPNITEELIMGWHQVSVNGKVIQSSLGKKSNKYDYKKKNHTIEGSLPCWEDTYDVLTLTFLKDAITDDTFNLSALELLDDKKHVQLFINPDSMTQKDYCPFPTGIILEKQE